MLQTFGKLTSFVRAINSCRLVSNSRAPVHEQCCLYKFQVVIFYVLLEDILNQHLAVSERVCCVICNAKEIVQKL